MQKCAAMCWREFNSFMHWILLWSDFSCCISICQFLWAVLREAGGVVMLWSIKVFANPFTNQTPLRALKNMRLKEISADLRPSVQQIKNYRHMLLSKDKPDILWSFWVSFCTHRWTANWCKNLDRLCGSSWRSRSSTVLCGFWWDGPTSGEGFFQCWAFWYTFQTKKYCWDVVVLLAFTFFQANRLRCAWCRGSSGCRLRRTPQRSSCYRTFLWLAVKSWRWRWLTSFGTWNELRFSDYSSYVDEMNKSGTYGDDITLMAAEAWFLRPLWVVGPDSESHEASHRLRIWPIEPRVLWKAGRLSKFLKKRNKSKPRRPEQRHKRDAIWISPLLNAL